MKKYSKLVLACAFSGALSLFSLVGAIGYYYESRQYLTPKVREYFELRTILENTRDLDDESFGLFEPYIINIAKKFEYMLKNRSDIIENKIAYENCIQRWPAFLLVSASFALFTGAGILYDNRKRKN